MQPRDGSDKAETEAIARAVSAALEPVESLEDALALLERDARTTIRYRDRGAVLGVRRRDLDVASPAVLDRIVDEVGDRLEQEVPVAKHEHPPAALALHATALLFGRGVEQLCNLASNVVQVHDAEASARIEPLDPRDPQERRKRPQYSIEFAHRVGDERMRAFGSEHLLRCLLQSAPQPGQRRP